MCFYWVTQSEFSFVITRSIICFFKKIPVKGSELVFYSLSSTLTLYLCSIGFYFNKGVGLRCIFKSYKMVFGEDFFKCFLNVVLYLSSIVFHVIFLAALIYHIQQVPIMKYNPLSAINFNKDCPIVNNILFL